MTLDIQGQGGEPESPEPPAATRWSEEDSGDEPGLMPPFIPGRAPSPRPAPGPAPRAAPPEAPVAPAGPLAPAAGADLEAEDDFPFDAFQIEGEAAGAGAVTEAAAAAGRVKASEPGPMPDPAGDVADRLERLAERIRRDGPAALEREMASGDRFGALLAGVLAGYLHGREG